DSFVEVLRINEAKEISTFVTNFMSASERKNKRRSNEGKAVNNLLVSTYLDRLTAALGDDGRFDSLFDELSANEIMTRNDIIALASQFCGQIGKSASRLQALQRIRARHTKLMKFKGHPSTTASQSAA